MITLDGRKPQRFSWPADLLERQSTLLAGLIDVLGETIVADRHTGHVDVHNEYRYFGHDVYESLVAPVADALRPDERLYLVTDGATAALPFEAAVLPDATKPVAATAGAVSLVRTNGVLGDYRLWSDDRLDVVFLDAIGDANGPDWQATRTSVEIIGGTATAHRIRAQHDLVRCLTDRRATIVDVLAHGVQGGRAVCRGPDPSHDPLIPVDEFVELIASTRPSVVLLRMCQSSDPGHHDGRDGPSIADRLLAAGTPYVIAARLPVFATAMAEFGYGFYTGLAAGNSIDDCIRSGRVHMAAASHGIHQAVLTVHAGTTDAAPHPLGGRARVVQRIIDAAVSHRRLPFRSIGAGELAGPTALLAPQARTTPFVGRDAEMKRLGGWLESTTSAPVSVAVVAGAAGAGKTRLALELVEHAATSGWTAGFVAETERDGDAIDALRGFDGDLLVVVDYAESSIAWAVRMLDALRRAAHDRPWRRVRVVLITRLVAADELVSSMGVHSSDLRQTVLRRRLVEVVELASGDLDDATADELLRQTVEHLQAGHPDLAERAALALRPTGRSPLEVSAAALAILLDHTPTTDERAGDALDDLLAHQLHYWYQNHFDRPHDALTWQPTQRTAQAIRRSIAVAALTGATTFDTLQLVLPVIPGLGDVGAWADWVADLARHGPLFPVDRLAEIHAVNVLGERPELLVSLLELESNWCVSQTVQMLARAQSFYPLPESVADVVVLRLPHLVERSYKSAGGTSGLLASTALLLDTMPTLPSELAGRLKSVMPAALSASTSLLVVAAHRQHSRATRGELNDSGVLTTSLNDATGLFLNNVAFLLWKEMDQLDDALPLLEDAHRLGIEYWGDRHPKTLPTLRNLAAIYRDMDRFDDALPLFEKAYELCVEVLGDRHPDTLTSLNKLAASYRSVGRSEEALPLFEKAYRLRVEVLGDHHPDTLISLNDLAGNYEAMGRSEDARALLE